MFLSSLQKVNAQECFQMANKVRVLGFFWFFSGLVFCLFLVGWGFFCSFVSFFEGGSFLCVVFFGFLFLNEYVCGGGFFPPGPDNICPNMFNPFG